MDGNFGDDSIEARSAASRLASFLELELASGTDLATLAAACLGLGVDTMAKATDVERTVQILRLLADELVPASEEIAREKPIRMH